MTCDGSTHGLSVHLDPASKLHERTTCVGQPGGFLGLCRVQTRAAHGDATVCEMDSRGQAVDVELFSRPAQGRVGLEGSDQLFDLGFGQKRLSHPK